MSVHTAVTGRPKRVWILKSRPGYKPLLFISAAVVFMALVLAPTPKSMLDMVGMANPPGYQLGRNCATITDTVNQKLRPVAFKVEKESQSASSASSREKLMGREEVAHLAKVMVAILFLAAFLWGTEALPLGATDIMVGVMLYLFCILPVNEISRAYMKDAVFFIFGILAVAVGVAKTGLDKRIGLILLSRIKSAKAFAFVFLPMLSISAGFLSEHALVALLIPVLMGIYKVTCKMYGVKKDRALAIFLSGISWSTVHPSVFWNG